MKDDSLKERSRAARRKAALGGEGVPPSPPAAVGTPLISRTAASLTKPTAKSQLFLPGRWHRIPAILLRKTGRWLPQYAAVEDLVYFYEILIQQSRIDFKVQGPNRLIYRLNSSHDLTFGILWTFLHLSCLKD